MNKINNFLYANRHFLMAFLFVGLFFSVGQIYGFDLNPQSNPFGTRGDQAIGSFGANWLTIINALGFYGGITCVFITIFQLAKGGTWLYPALGAVGGLGGWTIVGAVAYQMGSNQAFQIPGV